MDIILKIQEGCFVCAGLRQQASANRKILEIHHPLPDEMDEGVFQSETIPFPGRKIKLKKLPLFFWIVNGVRSSIEHWFQNDKEEVAWIDNLRNPWACFVTQEKYLLTDVWLYSQELFKRIYKNIRTTCDIKNSPTFIFFWTSKGKCA